MNRTRRSLGPRSKQGGIAVVVLVGIYSLAAPYINDRFGLDLPAIRAGADGQVEIVEADPGRDSPPIGNASGNSQTKPAAPRTSTDGKSDRAQSGEPVTQPSGPLADRARNASPGESRPASSKSPASAARSSTTSDDGTSDDGTSDDRTYGILQEVSRERYLSPAGLLYTPGSAEGHRLEHLRRHTVDDPSRPGSHGVFDGGMEGALKTIDRAYDRAKQGQRTTKRKDQGRTIYTVDMGGRVGFVGGRDGNRRRKPMARRVRIVLDGNRVITAYPL